MPEASDPYWKLAPEEATSSTDACQCPGTLPIVLQDHLSCVPLACLKCNGEVPPSGIGFPAALAEELASWRNFHRAFFTLWLDSGKYESWARAQLEDPESPVNTRGLQAVSKLNEYRRTYYWWFHDQDAGDSVMCPSCPRCDGPFTASFGKFICDRCSIGVSAG